VRQKLEEKTGRAERRGEGRGGPSGESVVTEQLACIADGIADGPFVLSGSCKRESKGMRKGDGQGGAAAAWQREWLPVT